MKFKFFRIFLIFFLTQHVYGELMQQKEIEPAKLDGAEYVTLDNGYRVWTKKIGHGPIKILLLHGGPGCTHEYFECFEKYFSKDECQIIFYDQLGSYYSDQPEDASLWKLDRFLEEVEQVRKALELEDFYLYGQSWGGLLAIEYALKYQKHLKGVILSNITGSVASYLTYLNYLRTKLPQNIQERLKYYEDKEEFSNPEYEKIMFEEVYAQYLCRIKPWPDSLVRTFAHLNKQVYLTIQGPNEFVVTGNFKDWNRWADLHNITIPTLVICGRYDTMSPQDNELMAKLIPNSKLVVCEKGSHCTMFDDPESYFPALKQFLFGIEGSV